MKYELPRWVLQSWTQQIDLCVFVQDNQPMHVQAVMPANLLSFSSERHKSWVLKLKERHLSAGNLCVRGLSCRIRRQLPDRILCCLHKTLTCVSMRKHYKYKRCTWWLSIYLSLSICNCSDSITPVWRCTVPSTMKKARYQRRM